MPFSSLASFSQPTEETKNIPIRPLQATVLGALDAARLKEGATFRVRVSAGWQDEDCRLKPGEIVEGRVVHVQKPTKTEKTSQFQLAFTAIPCAELRPQPLGLTLIALVGASEIPPEDDQNRLNQAPPLADVPGVSTATRYAMEAQSNPATAKDANAIRNAATQETVNGFKQLVSQKKGLPPTMSPGNVINAPRISLRIGAGDEGSTVVACSRGDARIESGSTLILVAADRLHLRQSEATTVPVHTAGSSVPPPAKKSEGPPVEASLVVPKPTKPIIEAQIENEVCSTTCVTLNTLEGRGAGKSKSSASVVLKGLGFAPRQAGWAIRFNHETTLTYLDEHHLLCTFDPHRLRMRMPGSPEPARDIRAVLIDPSTLKVQRVVEWQVRGEDAYLWRYGKGMVLVRMGSTLQLFDRELRAIKSISLEGEVAWVVSSPSVDHIAVGVLKHADASPSAAGRKKQEPEIEVSVYDGKLDLLSESTRSPGLYPPVLSDRGEVRLEHAGTGKWELLEYSWDRKETTLATVHSACRPLFSAEEDGLTFVTGCTSQDDNVWYRMLDAKGHTLLKAASFSDEMAHQADTASSGSFAIRTIRAGRHIPALEPFRRSDLLQERIEVFRGTDGRKVGSVQTDDFVLSDYSFALSPSGDQMAVVGKEAILFYKIGKEVN